MDAASMLDLVSRHFSSRAVIGSMQAPHPFYTSRKPGGSVGYNWGTPDSWQYSASYHHAFILAVLASLQPRFGIPPSHSCLLGFSQPVGLNYRFAATHPGSVAGVIGICGGVPRDWEDSPLYGSVPASLLHVARNQDEFYPLDKVREFEPRLRLRAADVEFHLIEGQHRFPSKAKPVFDAWLARVFPGVAL